MTQGANAEAQLQTKPAKTVRTDATYSMNAYFIVEAQNSTATASAITLQNEVGGSFFFGEESVLPTYRRCGRRAVVCGARARL